MEKVKIGFIGAGNMGTAIMKGIAGSTLAEQVALYAYDHTTEKTAALAADGVTACADVPQVFKTCKYVFLAIKPQQFDSVLPQIAEEITEDTVIVSIAAGITPDYIRSQTKPQAKVIQVMPNTPLLLGKGATALSRNDAVSDAEFSFVEQLFALCGVTSVLPLDKMAEVIAINGSSPAFIYLFAKGFLDYAKEVGIDETAAKQLFAQSLIGSAAMLTDSGYDVDTLIKQVSSPGGTTLAGLDALYEGKLEDTVKDACRRCTKRAYELSK
jgi:pyrroline-5-carboxylate reductase